MTEVFQITPLSTSNLLTVIQIFVVGAGFYFSYQGLKTARASLDTAAGNLAIAATSSKLSASNAQAQLFNQMVLQGRDLHWRRWQLFVDPLPQTSTQAEKDALKIKQDEYIRMIIGYYASCFELKQVLALPDSVNRLFDADIKESMRQKKFQDEFTSLKNLNVMSKDFIRYVENLSGV